MDQSHLRAKTSQKQRFLSSGIAATNHHDFHVAVERTIASRTCCHALAAKHFLLAGHTNKAWACTSRDDHGLGFVDFIPSVKFLHRAIHLDLIDLSVLVARTELRRLLAQVIHHGVTIDSFRETREILNLRSRGELPTWLRAFEHQRIQLSTTSVNGCSESGTTGS